MSDPLPDEQDERAPHGRDTPQPVRGIERAVSRHDTPLRPIPIRSR